MPFLPVHSLHQEAWKNGLPGNIILCPDMYVKLPQILHSVFLKFKITTSLSSSCMKLTWISRVLLFNWKTSKHLLSVGARFFLKGDIIY